MENTTRDLMAPFTKNKLAFFKEMKNKVTESQTKKLAISKDHASLFGQLFVMFHNREGNLAMFFERESVLPPRSMKPTSDKQLFCTLFSKR